MSDIKNATIEYAKITVEDHGFLTVWIGLDYGDSLHQGFGGYALGRDDGSAQKPFFGIFVGKCMKVADVTDWSKIVGRTVRVKSTHAGVDAIGHITKNIWFEPKKEFQS